MKMIRAIIRPEREEKVINSMEAEGFYAITKLPVLGRGRQKGIQVGAIKYDLLSKVMLLLVVDDEHCEKALRTIEEAALTGYPGDGRIFVQDVRESYAIRTGIKSETID